MAKIIKIADTEKNIKASTVSTGADAICLQILLTEFQMLEKELKSHFKRYNDEGILKDNTQKKTANYGK